MVVEKRKCTKHGEDEAVTVTVRRDYTDQGKDEAGVTGAGSSSIKAV